MALFSCFFSVFYYSERGRIGGKIVFLFPPSSILRENVHLHWAQFMGHEDKGIGPIKDRSDECALSKSKVDRGPWTVDRVSFIIFLMGLSFKGRYVVSERLPTQSGLSCSK